MAAQIAKEYKKVMHYLSGKDSIPADNPYSHLQFTLSSHANVENSVTLIIIIITLKRKGQDQCLKPSYLMEEN